MIAHNRYVNCIGCGYIVSGLQNEALRFDMDCPDCGAPKQFGPTAWVPDYRGKTFQEAARCRRERAARSTDIVEKS